MSDKERYKSLCSEEESIPIFSRDWYLDAVCMSENWDVILIEEKGTIKLSCPIFCRSKRIISMPPFTQCMGPWIAPAAADVKYGSELGQRQRLLEQLTDSLSRYSHYLQNFNHNITDWLPFYWAGYSQTSRYTYLLPDISNPAKLFSEMSVHTRRNIAKAKNKHSITVRKGVSIEEFLCIQDKTFDRQGLSIDRHKEALIRLINAARQRGQGDIWGGYDPHGKLHAAAFVVWQPSCAYYIAGGGCPELRNSGAHALVLWEVIKQMKPLACSFDFEGSMLKGVERFFRGFGAKQTEYYTISKGKLSLLDKILLRLK